MIAALFDYRCGRGMGEGERQGAPVVRRADGPGAGEVLGIGAEGVVEGGGRDPGSD